jgi:exopolysaccharide biosynthesis protein
MMKKSAIFFLSILTCFCMSCGSGGGKSTDWYWNNTGSGDNSGTSGGSGSSTEANSDIVKLGWTNANSSFGTLPAYIDVYRSPATLQNKKAIAYIAVADMSKASFGVWGDVAYDATAKGWGGTKVYTPSEIYSKTSATIVINGGLFFWDSSNVSSGFYYSMSLLMKDGALLSPNQNYYSEDWKTLWYPTVGAFYQATDGTFKATWTYYTSDKKNYCYDAPADNSISKSPLAVPSATSPSTGSILTAKNAIGGVSVLLHNGVVKNTYVQEMFNVSAATNQPRTAIGYNTSSNKLIFFVCQGREVTAGVAGLTTADEAEVMKALGCTEALNLDGGGSSCMLVNGKETITPSDKNSAKTAYVQRSVLTGCYLK